jgi:hypothetical protein
MATAVSVLEVVDALELASDEMSSFVNTSTGEVRTVTHEDLQLAEDEDDPSAPDWQRQAVEDARAVINSDEWIELPSKFDIHEWEIMDRFSLSLSNDEAMSELRGSLRGPGAFRHFKATVRRLDLEDAWFAYKRRTLEAMAKSWISDHGMRPDESPRSPT